MKTLIFGPSVIGVIYGGDVIHTAPADNQRRNLMPSQETTSVVTKGEEMNENSITRFMIFGLLIFATACSPSVVVVQPTSFPTQDSNAILTAAAQIVQVQTPSQAAPTGTSMPATATQAYVAQPISTSMPTTTGCVDAAQYINDDGLDGTTYAPNTPFTKTWTVKNTGSCTWDSGYLVAYVSGTTMTQQPGYWIVPQGQTVTPGQTVNISVGMTSPVENGSYQSYWGLKKENEPLMPIQGGANGNSFYVKIKVGNGVASGNVTDASIAIELEQGSGGVCTAYSTYFVHAHITADGPTTAKYEINSTAGQIAAGNFQNLLNNELSPVETGTLVFDQADTKTLSWRFVGPYPYPDDISVNLRVNGGEWHASKLSCLQ